jgi:integrase
VKIEELLEHYRERKTPSEFTLRHYNAVIMLFCRETRTADVEDVAPTTVAAWREAVLARASASTWNNYLAHLRVLWNWAVAEGLARENPFAAVSRARELHRRPKTVAAALLRRALATLDGADAPVPGWFWRIVLRTFYYTGMRRRQLVAVRWEHVGLEAARLTLAAEGSKTRREWEIPLAPETVEDLSLLRQETLAATGGASLRDRQVFNATLFNPRYKGQELDEFQVSGFFGRLSKRLGEPVSPHRLRHTMATALAPHDIKALQNMLGHQDVRTTLQYVHPDISAMRKLQEGLPKL